MFEAGSGIYTEVQPGSFLLNDMDYSLNLNDEGKTLAETQEWQQSLFVYG